MKALLIVFLAFFANSINAQTTTCFEELDKDLTSKFESIQTYSDEIYSSKGLELKNSEGLLIKDLINDGFFFDQYLNRSGSVIFNSEAGEYLNDVKNYLLKDYPHIKELIHIYITKSPVINAFATISNDIYINIGLLAKVENEAQLAFILSHEIMHIVNDHLVNQRLETDREEQKFNEKDLLLKKELITLKRHSLSRENETEADIDGFTLIANSSYSLKEAIKALELLKTPIEDLSFIKSNYFFADSMEYSIIQKLYNVDSFKAKKKDTINEEYSTHPNIVKRISNLEELFKSQPDTSSNSKNTFLVSSVLFYKVKKSAESSIPYLFLDNLDFNALFIHASENYFLRKDASIENIEYLAFAIQGLYLDRLLNKEIDEVYLKSKKDSMIYYFQTKSENKVFFNWCYKAFSNLETMHPQPETILSYKLNMVSNIKKHLSDSLVREIATLEDLEKSNVYFFKKNLNPEDIHFNVSAQTSMTFKQYKEYNQSKGIKEKDGKIAIINFSSYKFKVPIWAGKIKTLPKDSEKLNRKAYKAFLYLEKDMSAEVLSLIPNDQKYSSSDYKKYTILNQWLQTRLYFDEFTFVDFNKTYVDSIRKVDNIDFVMVSMNIEYNSYNNEKETFLWFSMIPMPHYIPQQMLNVIIGSTRNYKLTMIYDIESGGLVFWDKQSTLEPSTSAQLYFLYEEILSNFIKR